MYLIDVYRYNVNVNFFLFCYKNENCSLGQRYGEKQFLSFYASHYWLLTNFNHTFFFVDNLGKVTFAICCWTGIRVTEVFSVMEWAETSKITITNNKIETNRAYVQQSFRILIGVDIMRSLLHCRQIQCRPVGETSYHLPLI